MTDETICECGHRAVMHSVDFGCQDADRSCLCGLSEEKVLRTRLAALTLAVGEGLEREKKLREGYQELLDWFDNAPFDYSNGIVAQGVDEGEYYGTRGHKMLSDKGRALIAETAPATEAGK